MRATWEASRTENTTATVLGATLVAGVYADGWAHLNIGGLETFFTPWHGGLYGAFTLLTAWLVGMVARRRDAGDGWLGRVPTGYGWGLVGVAVFGAGGVLDMGWHLAFGIETGLDALVSPTHLMLLTGGVLLITSPLRALTSAAAVNRPWPAIASLAAATSLTGFFLSYLSVFVDPGAREPLVTIPEGLPGHRAAELPAIAGLGGYLVTTALLVVPLVYLHRRLRLPRGSVTFLVGAVALPAAALSQLTFIAAATGALVGAALVDVVLTIRPDVPDVVLAGLVPALVWAGQLLGLASVGELRWPPELWAGVVALAALLAVAGARLWGAAPSAAPAPHSGSLPTAPTYQRSRASGPVDVA